MATVFSVGGVFLFVCTPGFFCIALLYKMCLEIVVIYSSRNTTGYLLYCETPGMNENQTGCYFCIVSFSENKVSISTKQKYLNACIFLGGISERSLCYSIDASVLLSQVTCKSSSPGQLGVHV